MQPGTSEGPKLARKWRGCLFEGAATGEQVAEQRAAVMGPLWCWRFTFLLALAGQAASSERQATSSEAQWERAGRACVNKDKAHEEAAMGRAQGQRAAALWAGSAEANFIFSTLAPRRRQRAGACSASGRPKWASLRRRSSRARSSLPAGLADGAQSWRPAHRDQWLALAGAGGSAVINREAGPRQPGARWGPRSMRSGVG